jgi:hypothetical protein
MHKLIFLSAAALLAGALAGGAQATPLSATGAMAMSGVADQAMPDQGVIKARWHQRHYRWSRGYHYGWRHHYSRRYADYRGSRNFQSQFDVDYCRLRTARLLDSSSEEPRPIGPAREGLTRRPGACEDGVLVSIAT